MPNIDDLKTPEELLKGAVEVIRNSNGVKLFFLPSEASDRQEAQLTRELRARHPWHHVLVVTHAAPPTLDEHGTTHPTPKTEEPHTLEALREMIETPESLGLGW